MPWICPQDGTEVQDTTSICVLCGYVRVPVGVELRSAATGETVTARIEATFGRAALQRLRDPEVRYVGEQQFVLEKHSDVGVWSIRHVAFATNPTYLNDAPIDPAGNALSTGDVISIRGLYFRLSVRLLT